MYVVHETLKKKKEIKKNWIEAMGEWIDIMGSGAVKMRTVKEGDGNIPEYKQIVHIHYQGMTNGKVFIDTRSGDPVEVTIGDQVLDVVVPGVMLVSKMMKTGEICEAKVSHRFGYGDEGLPPHVGFQNDLEFRIEMLSIRDFEKEAVDMSPEELAIHCAQRKDRGNFFFKAGNISKAMHCYQDGLKKSESHIPQQDEDGNMVPNEYTYYEPLNELRGQLAGNLSACFEHQEKWKEAKDACVAALTVNPTHLKILLRAARISMMQGDFQEAAACLASAHRAHPENTTVKRESAKLRDKISAYKEKEKKNFGGFFVSEESKSLKNEDSESLDIEESKSLKNEEPKSLDNEESKTEQIGDFVKVQKRTRLKNILVLIAPTIIAIIIFLTLPVMVESSMSWASESQDLSLNVFKRTGISTLVCEGRNQRPSCCICLQAMQQIVLRQQKISNLHPNTMVQVGGFRMDGSSKAMVPLSQSEDTLISILDNLCERIPVDIPTDSLNKVQTKIALAKACLEIVDHFYDDILRYLMQGGVSGYALEDRVCREMTGVCNMKPDWKLKLLSFGDTFKNTPCSVCQSVAKKISDEKRMDEKDMRDPSLFCSTLKVSVPTLNEKERMQELSQAIGDACLDLIFYARQEISLLFSESYLEEKSCLKSIESLLCQSICVQSIL